ncbi:MAG TPA: hypothetical protein VGE40_13160 [Bacilli bacterium]
MRMGTKKIRKRMNLTVIFSLMISMFCFAAFMNQPAVQAATSWTTWNLTWKNSTLQVIVPGNLTDKQSRIAWLIEMADRSMNTTDPLNTDVNGLINPGDIVVVSNSNLLWFDKTNDGSSTTNGGGGMLRGLWPLHLDGSNNLNFERIINASNYSPNYLFAGSKPGLQGSGASLLGNYTNVDNGNTWAIEHEAKAVVTAFTGTTIADGGLYNNDGVFVQFQGLLANSPNITLPSGIDSLYDVDKRAGVEGRVKYTLTYRIPSTTNNYRQEISLNVTQNNFGPIATMVVSHNVAGYDGNRVTYGVDPDLITSSISNTENRSSIVLTSNYYSVSGYTLKFYDLPWVAHGKVKWAETPLGKGKLLSAGLPQLTYPVRFFEFRPLTSQIPSRFQSTYALQAIDNQGISSNRVNALDFQLFDTNRGHSEQTFITGDAISLMTDDSLR